MSVLDQFKTLAAQLESLKEAARAELVVARARVAELEAIVGEVRVQPKAPATPIATGSPADPWSETDAGMGVSGDGGNGRATFEEFQDELAEVRERSAQRRARRGA